MAGTSEQDSFSDRLTALAVGITANTEIIKQIIAERDAYKLALGRIVEARDGEETVIAYNALAKFS